MDPCLQNDCESAPWRVKIHQGETILNKTKLKDSMWGWGARWPLRSYIEVRCLLCIPGGGSPPSLEFRGLHCRRIGAGFPPPLLWCPWVQQVPRNAEELCTRGCPTLTQWKLENPGHRPGFCQPARRMLTFITALVSLDYGTSEYSCLGSVFRYCSWYVSQRYDRILIYILLSHLNRKQIHQRLQNYASVHCFILKVNFPTHSSANGRSYTWKLI